MITDLQKEEIFLKIAPYELYYYDDAVMKHVHNGAIKSLSNDFENEKLFAVAVNDLLKLNSVLFFNAVSRSNLSKIEFIDYVNNQCNVFKENNEGKGLNQWLNHTKKIIFDKELNYYPKEVSMENKGTVIKWFNEKITTLSNETKIDRKKPKLTFFDFIHNVEDKEAFAEELKNTFNIESGIDFKIMIELLKEAEIFSFTYLTKFLKSIKEYFNREIGEYSGINDKYKHTPDEKTIHAERIKRINKKIKPLITKYKLN